MQVRCSVCLRMRNVSSVRYAQYVEKHNVLCRSCSQAKAHNNRFLPSHINEGRSRAEARGIAWGLTLSDLEVLWKKQDGRCVFSGEILCKNPKTWSIDRIDNSCGYFPDNIQLTSIPINMMRGSLSVEKFVFYCKQVARYRSEDE